MKRTLYLCAQVIGVGILWVFALSMIISIGIAVWHGFDPSGFPTNPTF